MADALMHAWSRQYERIHKSLFANRYALIEAQAKAQATLKHTEKGDSSTAALFGLDDLKWDEENQALLADVKDAYAKVLSGAALGVAQKFGELGGVISWDVYNAAAAEYAKAYTYDLVSKINGSTKQQLGEAISGWIASGDPFPDLVEKVWKVVPANPYDNVRDRAQLIAATETTRVFATAQQSAFKASGLKHMVWRTAEDEVVCPTCHPLGAANGGEGAVGSVEGGVFISPGNGQTVPMPPAHPGCRCWLVADTMELDELQAQGKADLDKPVKTKKPKKQTAQPTAGASTGVAGGPPIPGNWSDWADVQDMFDEDFYQVAGPDAVKPDYVEIQGEDSWVYHWKNGQSLVPPHLLDTTPVMAPVDVDAVPVSPKVKPMTAQGMIEYVMAEGQMDYDVALGYVKSLDPDKVQKGWPSKYQITADGDIEYVFVDSDPPMAADFDWNETQPVQVTKPAPALSTTDDLLASLQVQNVLDGLEPVPMKTSFVPKTATPGELVEMDLDQIIAWVDGLDGHSSVKYWSTGNPIEASHFIIDPATGKVTYFQKKPPTALEDMLDLPDNAFTVDDPDLEYFGTSDSDFQPNVQAGHMIPMSTADKDAWYSNLPTAIAQSKVDVGDASWPDGMYKDPKTGKVKFYSGDFEDYGAPGPDDVFVEGEFVKTLSTSPALVEDYVWSAQSDYVPASSGKYQNGALVEMSDAEIAQWKAKINAKYADDYAAGKMADPTHYWIADDTGTVQYFTEAHAAQIPPKVFGYSDEMATWKTEGFKFTSTVPAKKFTYIAPGELVELAPDAIDTWRVALSDADHDSWMKGAIQDPTHVYHDPVTGDLVFMHTKNNSYFVNIPSAGGSKTYASVTAHDLLDMDSINVTEIGAQDLYDPLGKMNLGWTDNSEFQPNYLAKGVIYKLNPEEQLDWYNGLSKNVKAEWTKQGGHYTPTHMLKDPNTGEVTYYGVPGQNMTSPTGIAADAVPSATLKPTPAPVLVDPTGPMDATPAVPVPVPASPKMTGAQLAELETWNIADVGKKYGYEVADKMKLAAPEFVSSHGLSLQNGQFVKLTPEQQAEWFAMLPADAKAKWLGGYQSGLPTHAFQPLNGKKVIYYAPTGVVSPPPANALAVAQAPDLPDVIDVPDGTSMYEFAKTLDLKKSWYVNWKPDVPDDLAGKFVKLTPKEQAEWWDDLPLQKKDEWGSNEDFDLLPTYKFKSNDKGPYGGTHLYGPKNVPGAVISKPTFAPDAVAIPVTPPVNAVPDFTPVTPPVVDDAPELTVADLKEVKTQAGTYGWPPVDPSLIDTPIAMSPDEWDLWKKKIYKWSDKNAVSYGHKPQATHYTVDQWDNVKFYVEPAPDGFKQTSGVVDYDKLDLEPGVLKILTPDEQNNWVWDALDWGDKPKVTSGKIAKPTHAWKHPKTEIVQFFVEQPPKPSQWEKISGWNPVTDSVVPGAMHELTPDQVKVWKLNEVPKIGPKGPVFQKPPTHVWIDPKTGETQLYAKKPQKGTPKKKPVAKTPAAVKPVTPPPAAAPVVTPKPKATPPPTEFPYKVADLTRSAKQVSGGAHTKFTLEDPDGGRWLFKPQDEFRALGDEVAYRLAAVLDHKSAPTYVVEYNGRKGSIQKLFDVTGDLGNGAQTVDVLKLTPDEILAVQKEHVFDWLIGNNDGHAANFLRVNGELVGIDKGQLFKFYDTERLHWTYNPNESYGVVSVQNRVVKNYAEGGPIAMRRFDDDPDLLAFMKKVQDLDDDTFREIVRPYAEKAQGFVIPGKGGKRALAYQDVDKFLDAAVKRKNTIRQQFADLQKQADIARAKALGIEYVEPVKAVTPVSPVLADAVHTAGWQGKSVMVGGADIEDMNALVYEIDGVGTVWDLKVRKTAQPNLLDVLGGPDKFSLGTSAVTAPPPPPDDPYWNDVLKIVKSYNTHMKAGGDGIFPPANLDLAKKHLDNWQWTKGGDPAAAHHYDALKALYDDVQANTFPGSLVGKTLEPYVAPKAAPLPVAAPVAGSGSPLLNAKKGKNRTWGVRNVDGRLVPDTSTVQVRSATAIEIDAGPDVQVIYTPHTDSSTEYSDQGRLRIRVLGEASKDKLDRALDVLGQLGLDNKLATPEDVELLYLRKVSYAAGVDPDGVDIPGLTTGERVQKFRDFWSKRMNVADVTKLPQYDPTPHYDAPSWSAQRHGATEGVGIPRFRRFDITMEQLEREVPDLVLVHSLTGNVRSPLEFLQKALADNGSLVATETKFRLGIPVNSSSGMSAGPDQASGGASYVFTRQRTEASANSSSYAFVFDKSALLDPDAIVYSGDNYGKVTPENIANNRQRTVKDWQRISRGGGSDETIFKGTLSFADYLKHINVRTSTERNEVLDLFRKYGVTHIRNVPIETVVRVAR